MAAFDRATNASHAFKPGLPAFGRAHSETGGDGTCSRGRVAIGAIGFGAGQIQGVQHAGGLLGCGRLDNHAAEDLFGLLSVMGCGGSDRRAQRHAAFVGRQMHGRAAFGPIYWTGACRFPPF